MITVNYVDFASGVFIISWFHGHSTMRNNNRCDAILHVSGDLLFRYLLFDSTFASANETNTHTYIRNVINRCRCVMNVDFIELFVFS